MGPEQIIAVTRELYRFWWLFNEEYARGAMRAPQIRVAAELTATLGSWNAATREIRIAAAHVETAEWIEVCGTLRHEMAHQFADEVLGASDEAPHGPAFRRACELLRVEPTATGGDDRSREETSRLVARVQKLFALGSSPNEHEAESAMRKARELVAEHELADLRSDRVRDYDVRELGDVKKRHARWEYVLSSVLGEFFCVEPIWAPSYDRRQDRCGTALHVYGAERNLLLAEHVFECLTRMLEPLWREHRARQGIRGNRDRQRYWEGLLTGFQDRLRGRGEGEARESSAARELRALQARGDVDPRLTSFFRWHNPLVRTARVGSSADTEAWAHGRRDGRSLSIEPPLTGGRREAVRRLEG